MLLKCFSDKKSSLLLYLHPQLLSIRAQLDPPDLTRSQQGISLKRPHHPGAGSRQDSVQGNTQESRQRAMPALQQPAEEPDEQTRDDGKIEPTDGEPNEMCLSSLRDVLHDNEVVDAVGLSGTYT